MEFYLIIVILLFILAFSDLVVGVSNDAVNFLNSAVGSKVANRRTIMIVASVGIILGATFASGMMEVARKGIFNPQHFVFAEVMIIFLAVMLTDIILLDLFNTFALPTSTTVSIVFELLGAAVAVSFLKVMSNGEGLSAIGSTYINSSTALTIITGIFISVGIAFTVGAIVQWISRVLFTFNYSKKIKSVGIIWSGLALAFIFYFLMIKGLKGASFVPESIVAWTNGNTFGLLGIAFLVMTAVAFVLHLAKVNILRIVVLAGTFALAMAFAGNDLVNFIGVPLAGFESYNTWLNSGEEANGLLMTSLEAAKYRAPTYFLLIAGFVMVATLWLSKKAQSVTETEVNLGRQSEGLERFSSNRLSRGIVRSLFGLAGSSGKAIPSSWQQRIKDSFEPLEYVPKEGEAYDPPAFDLVRASVNLTVASILIAIATSYKLPLSTTYVSFMVAMGTSLSDRAWGRDSAVFRVAGVLNVIGGWFMTAFIAFTVAATFAYLMSTFGGWAIAIIVTLAVVFLTNTFLLHRRREKSKEKIISAQKKAEKVAAEIVINDIAHSIVAGLDAIRVGYKASIEGLATEDRRKLNEAKEAMEKLVESNEEFKYTFYGSIRRIKEDQAEGSRTLLLAYDLEQDFVQSAEFIVRSIKQHVDDVLMPLKETQISELRQVAEDVDAYLAVCANIIRTRDFSTYQKVLDEKQPIFIKIENLLAEQSKGIKHMNFSARNSILFFNVLLETKDLIAVAARFVKLYYRLEKEHSEENPWVLVSGTE